MTAVEAYLVRLRIYFSRVRLWQTGMPLELVLHQPIMPSSRYFGTVDGDAMGLDQVLWTSEHLVAPYPSPDQPYTFLSLMDDMACQIHSPELRHIIIYVVDRADFNALPHFRSYTCRMLRYSARDDSSWQVNPFQYLPIGRLVV